jgi:hypothetical protein
MYRSRKAKPMSKIKTPLASKYQHWVDKGLVSPEAQVGPFRYPSALINVPTIAAGGVASPASAQGGGGGDLDRDTQGNR